jgi:putative membrane protein
MVFRWIITTLAVWVAVELIPGVHYDRLQSLVLAALVLGLLNVFVKPILALLTAPLIVLSFGLFVILINAALLQWTAAMVPGFSVDSWGDAMLASMIISVVSLAFAGGHILLART